jgi:hypothetical protein
MLVLNPEFARATKTGRGWWMRIFAIIINQETMRVSVDG